MKPARDRVRPVIRRLKRHYPEARCSLDYRSPLELLVATILSAQCTDERVNLVTPTVFARYPAARDYADANPEELETIIKSTGFFRNKARSLIGMGKALVERHRAEVPRTMAELVQIPGVGRKTANVVLGNAYGVDQGVVVDTHVARISQRLGFTRHTEPARIEHDLMALVPRKEWTLFPHLLIHHGRAICQARKPMCEMCPVNDLCPFPKGRSEKRAVRRKGGQKRGRSKRGGHERS